MPTLEDLNESLRSLRKDEGSIKEAIEWKQKEEKYDKMAYDVFLIYSSYLNAGFTEAQAWEMLITLIKTNNKLYS